MKCSDVVFGYDEIWQSIFVIFAHITCIAFANNISVVFVSSPPDFECQEVR